MFECFDFPCSTVWKKNDCLISDHLSALIFSAVCVCLGMKKRNKQSKQQTKIHSEIATYK